jgi:hypothetical protein
MLGADRASFVNRVKGPQSRTRSLIASRTTVPLPLWPPLAAVSTIWWTR